MKKPCYSSYYEVPTSKFTRFFACIQMNGTTVHKFFPGIKNQHFSLQFEDGCSANMRLVFPKDDSPCKAFVTWFDQDHNEIADICYGQSLGPFKFDMDHASYVCEIAAVRKMERLPEAVAWDFLAYCNESKIPTKDIVKIIRFMDKQMKQEQSLSMSR